MGADQGQFAGRVYCHNIHDEPIASQQCEGGDMYFDGPTGAPGLEPTVRATTQTLDESVGFLAVLHTTCLRVKAPIGP